MRGGLVAVWLCRPWRAQRTFNIAVVDSTRLVLTPTQSGLDEALENAMKTAREVVYNRVDPEGTKEVTVIRQGKDRILVQVPGLKDPEGLKALMPSARLQIVAGAGHMGPITHAKDVNAAILRQIGEAEAWADLAIPA
jgi:preprotein translocase subunit SecD